MKTGRGREGLVLVAAFFVAAAVSAAWERAERIEAMSLLQAADPRIPRIRIGDWVPPGWPVAREHDVQSVPPNRYAAAVFFVTPTCLPCRWLLDRLSQAPTADRGVHSVVVVAGWSPLESMKSYCQRHLGWVARHATVLPDDDARLTKRTLGQNPPLPAIVSVDAAGIVRGIETGLSADTTNLVRLALTQPLSSHPVPVPSAFQRAEFTGEDGQRVSATSLVAADLAVLVRVSTGCQACGRRVADLARLTDRLRRRVVFVASDRPLSSLSAFGSFLTYDRRNADAVRSVFPAEFVPQCVVFRRGRMVLREETPWGREEMVRFLSWCALQS